jgi:hypothetical protein
MRRLPVAPGIVKQRGKPLPRPAARLLWVMFSTDDVCRQSLDALVAEGFTRKTLPECSAPLLL